MSAQKEYGQAIGLPCKRRPTTVHLLDGTSEAYAFPRLSTSQKSGPLQ